ncbi:acyl dehydratase [Brevibacillus sp. HB1.2]|uniref:MaoC family dehydratase n=1 Tax=Brevibacillus TaxID=55080 RepID=UPI0005590E18|nr:MULTISPECIES: MaoC/PaaZ C-terminal domain-containing protein [unclassified Brevibacillus]NRS15386.1 MaoC family dehydratase N-terminal domain-containing protein [Brevibacillus sp. HB1.4B]NTU18958.1 acyl dehydratase [Brevibacillus sp. HB1.2]
MSEQILYFEDFEVGTCFTSPARTITEADVVNFAGLSGDYNALHVDAEYAKSSIYGERVAHGLLGLAVSSGLFTRTELNRRMAPSLIALLGIQSWRFLGPLKIGDTIHLEVEIVEKEETSKPDRGIVFFKRKMLNQRGEVVQEGTTPMLIRRK